MSSNVHQHHLNHQHYSGSSSSLNFLNSALVSILSNKYPELSLNDDAIMYIKYLVMKIIKILMSGHTLTLGHSSSSSPLATSSGTLITNVIGSTNGPTVGSLPSSSSRSSSSSSSVLIRLGDLKERINLLFPCKLDQEIIQKADEILFDLNSSSHDSTLYREGSVNENSSTGNLRSSLLNQTGITKLSGKSRKPPYKHKLNKISSLTSAHVIHIPYLSFSHFFRELLGGGKDIKFDPDPDVVIYIIVVIEHIVTNILESSGKFVSNIPEKTTISKEDVRISMYAGAMIKSLFNPDDEVNYDHEDAILCLHSTSSSNASTIMSNSGSNHSSTTTPAPLSLCFFSLDLDPKFISKLIENKENEKLLKLQPLSLTGSQTQACTDVDVNDSLFHPSTGTNAGGCATNNFNRSSQLKNMNQNVTYENVVKELILEEKLFIRDLQLIIKLFREPFLEVMKQQETDFSSLPSSPTSPTSPSPKSVSLMSTVVLNDQQSSVPSSPIHKSFGTRIKTSEIDAIFSNITDIEELSVKLLCCLEDTLEAMISSNLSNDDVTKTGSGNNLSGSNPGSVTSMSKSVIESIGSVFQDFAEDQEFDVYETFASDIIGYHHALHLQNNNNNNNNTYGVNKNNMMNDQRLAGHSNWSTSSSNQVLQELLADSMISKALATARNGFVKENKYILPKFFNRIIYHCYTYFNYISILKSLSPSEEDRESFSVVEGLLKPLELKLGMITGITFKAGIKVPVLFGLHFFTLHHPGLTSPTTNPSANTGTLNPSSGAPTSLASAKMVTSFCPLMSYSLKLSSVNTNHEIMDLISKIDGLDMTTHQHMNCLVLMGSLYKSSSGTGKAHQKISERRAFLFDGVLLLCKDVLSSKRSTTVGSTSGGSIHYGQTKRYLISKIEVIDLPDPPLVHSSASFSVGSALNKGGGDPCCSNSVINPSLPGHPQSSNEDHLRELTSASALSSPWGTSTTSLLSISSNSLIPGPGIHSKSDYIPRVKNAFKINVRDSKEFIVLSTNTSESKNLWISNLTFLTSRPNLEKTLESILIEEDRKNPLQIPSPSVYQFSVPDSESNIIFEVDKFNNAGAPLIKAATMAKLIERLTYHLHADPTFVRVFLTTYRSFSTPRELLTLLIDRFNVPDIESKAREDVKKFEKDYVNPVQLRVLNVIRTWVAHHYYDFTNDGELLNDLIFFLEKKTGKSKTKLKKWVDSILKNIYKNKEIAYNNIHTADLSLLFNSNPPHFEWHIISAENVSTASKDMFNLLTLHPIEFARQFTLLEYDLFKKVKPSEIVDCAWTKSDKERKSPNLLRFTNFGNNFTYWLEQQILEADNFEERVAVYSRIIEILQVFQELNNFDGIICTVAALTSAAVYRLESTKEAMPKALKKSFEEAEKLNQGHHKKYFEMLRSINPPCVPFLGKYLTYIVQIHEGNTDETHISVRDELRSYATGETIATSTLSLINFSKRRKVAEITQEIQQYQNTPYCLNPEPHIREFLESIKPLESSGFVEYLKRIAIEKGSDQVPDVFSMGKDERVKHFHDYLQEMSLDIEPRKMSDGARKPVKKADRRWPEMSLKSPGIKPSQPPPMASPTVTSSGNNSSASSCTLSNTLSRARGVFASAVATSGLSSSSSHKNPIQSNSNEISLPMDSSSQISPNAVTLTLHCGSSFGEKDHYPINLPSNADSSNAHHHHVRQSSLTQQQQGLGIHGSLAHHGVDVPISMSSSLHSFSDYSIFAPVMIGGNNSNDTHSSYPPLTPAPSTPIIPGHRPQFSFSGSNSPPALPPRRQRLVSTTSQSYDESMSSHCSGGSSVTLQPPPRPPHPITPLIPSTPSTPGSSTTSYSGQSQSRNFFYFPPPLPSPEAVPPVIPPRPEKLSKLINLATAPSSEYPPVESNIPGASFIEETSPPPLPPRGIQPPLVVHRHSFHHGSSSQLLYQTPPSPSTTLRHAS